MCDFETRISENELFPRIWWRYVDDIFAIVNKRKTTKINKFINSIEPSIQFTCEEETNNQLPFLDVMITRSEINTIVFDVYRKRTFLPKYITADSYHNEKHKKAAFNSIVHRMVHLNMPPENLDKETEMIMNIAKINGYTEDWVTKIIKKMTQKQYKTTMTKLLPIKEDNILRRISTPYFPEITNKLTKILRKHKIQLITKSSNTTKRELNNHKDKRETTESSGVYEITCNDCDKRYIGQTKRSIQIRFDEHKRATNNNKKEDSSVAKHMIDHTHNFTQQNLKLLKNVCNWKLDAYESMYINKHNYDDLINEDHGPIPYSSLFNLL